MWWSAKSREEGQWAHPLNLDPKWSHFRSFSLFHSFQLKFLSVPQFFFLDHYKFLCTSIFVIPMSQHCGTAKEWWILIPRTKFNSLLLRPVTALWELSQPDKVPVVERGREHYCKVLWDSLRWKKKGYRSCSTLLLPPPVFLHIHSVSLSSFNVFSLFLSSYFQLYPSSSLWHCSQLHRRLSLP